ncbi:MAG: tetratricopeptide repeat protein [Candidatus Eisenbacteria bacterium]|nr:tetratricopeptide repeat protein [Candidatus Eisenbacteria bacterium]
MTKPSGTGEPADTTRIPLWVPALVALLAVAIRWLYVRQAGDLVLFNELTGDAAQYLELAGRLRLDGWLAPRGEAYFQAPLYSAYLALVGAEIGQLELARWIQFMAGAIGALLAWDTARRLAGSTAGLAAGLLAAGYGPRVFFEGELLSIAWSLLFIQGMLWLLVARMSSPTGKNDAMVAGMAGSFAGFAALAQPNTLLAGLAALVFLVLTGRTPPSARRGALAFALGLSLVILPITLRNRAESGDWVLISANGGINFFIGNNALADGTFHLPPGEPLLNDPDGLVVSAREMASRGLGRPAGPAAASSYWQNRGLSWWAAAPIDAAALTARKILYVLNDLEIPNHYDQAWFRARVPILRILPGFLLILPLAAWGFLRRGREPAGRLLIAVAAALILSVAFFFVTDRYRLPLVAVLLPAAGVGLADLMNVARRRPLTAALPAIMVVASFLVLAAFPLIDTTPSRAHMHNLVGTIHYKRGEASLARREFEEAVAIAPNLAEPANNLGRLALNAGDAAGAESWFRRAVTLDPRRPEAWFNLEEIERSRRQWRAALGLLEEMEQRVPGVRESFAGALAYRRGLSWQALGDTTAAGAALRRAVTVKPDLAGAWAALGTMAAAAGRYEDSRRHLETAAALSPNHFTTVYNLALVTERIGDYPAALALYRRAVALGGSEPELSRARERSLVLGRTGATGSISPKGTNDANR